MTRKVWVSSSAPRRPRVERAADQGREPARVAEAAAQPVGQGLRGQLHRDQLADRARDHRVLDDDPVGARRSSPLVDDGGDARPGRVGHARRLRARADPVDRVTGRIREPEHVAVAGEPGPEPVGDVEALAPGPEQDAGAAQGPGAEHHHVGGHGERRRVERIGAEPERLVPDRPPVTGRLDPSHLHFGEDLGAVVHRVREVVHEQRVLGPVVAAGHTVTAAGAGVLVDADLVGARPERDVDRGPVERGVAGHPSQRGDLGEGREVVGVRRRSQHRLRGPVAALETGPVGAQGGRPVLIVEHPRLGAERHVGVHERRPSQPATREDAHVLVDVERVQVPPVTDLACGAVELEVTPGVVGAPRVLAGVQLPAPLHHADGLPGSGEARRRDRGAVSRSDHDNPIVVSQFVQRARQPLRFRHGPVSVALPPGRHSGYTRGVSARADGRDGS